jgi:hypothetical protein
MSLTPDKSSTTIETSGYYYPVGPAMPIETPPEALAEVDRLRFALRVIAYLPVEEQDNLMAANMRKIAREALQ